MVRDVMIPSRRSRGRDDAAGRGFRLGFGDQEISESLDDARLYDSVLARRVVAFCLDFVLLGFVLGLVWFAAIVVGFFSFGILWPLMVLLATLAPYGYFVFGIVGPTSGSIGMRLFGLEVRSLSGETPHLIQAVAVFMFTVPATGGLVLLVPLFNARFRTLHDFLAGTVVINRLPESPPAADTRNVRPRGDIPGTEVRKSG